MIRVNFLTQSLLQEGIDTEAAECENNQDLVLSRFWEMEQEQVTDVQGKPSMRTCI